MRRGNAMRLNGIDAQVPDARRDRALDPQPRLLAATRAFRSMGGLLQPRGGTVRHDAVAWGYARAADARGVDIIQQCEVTGIRVEGGAVVGVETTQGFIATTRSSASRSPVTPAALAAMAGLTLPIESHVLQAMVSEPVKPVLDTVVTSGAVHFYISQSDKGELVMGGDLDFCNSYAQRGNLPIIEHVVAACLALFPSFGRLKVMRTWGGVMRHDDGRQPDHRQAAGQGPHHDRRLVLRRIQGDAGVRLAARVHDRARRAASAQRRVHARALRRTARRSTKRARVRCRGRIEHDEACAMLLIPCPWCGPRNQVEFTYGGDATVQRPAADARSTRGWFVYVYVRDNPAGSARRAVVPRRRLPAVVHACSATRARTTSSAAPPPAAPLRRERAVTQPFRLAAGGVVDRARPLRVRIRRRAHYRRLRRRHARLGAARQRRPPRRRAASSTTGRAASSAPAPTSRTRWSSSRAARAPSPTCARRRVELYDGLVATSQNRWPSRRFDVGAINDTRRALPARGLLLQDVHVAADAEVVAALRARRSATPRAWAARATRTRSRSLRAPVRALRRAGRSAPGRRGSPPRAPRRSAGARVIALRRELARSAAA